MDVEQQRAAPGCGDEAWLLHFAQAWPLPPERCPSPLVSTLSGVDLSRVDNAGQARADWFIAGACCGASTPAERCARTSRTPDGRLCHDDPPPQGRPVVFMAGQSALGMDAPVPAGIPAEVVGGGSLRRYMLDMIRREALTVRQAYERLLPAIGGPMFKGSAVEVADLMEDWWRAKAGDGFTVMAPVQPRGLRDVVDLVVPELQRRGLFRTEYAATTLRGHLGLPAAPSRWAKSAERGAA